MLIGYARVSTSDQNSNLQTDALTKAGCERIFTDVASGMKDDRSGLAEALGYLREGDTLVVWRLDRLGRSLGKLIELINALHKRKIGFQSLSDAIDTTTPNGMFFFHVTGAFAELERNLIRERTNAGLTAARARGRKGGRPRAVSPYELKEAVSLYKDQNLSVAAIAKKVGVAERTLYRYLSAVPPLDGKLS